MRCDGQLVVYLSRATISLGLALSTAASGLAAQQAETVRAAGSISGTVLAADAASPLPLAVVSLVPLASELPPEAAFAIPGDAETLVTRDDGTYRFTQVEPALYRLCIRRIGYRPTTVDVELKRPANVNVSAALEVAPVRLRLIEVNATSLDPYGRGQGVEDRAGNNRVEVEHWRQRSFLSSDVRALTHEDVLEAVTIGGSDPFRALQRLPGVTTRDNWTAETWTRGASWDKTRVYFDGLPLLNPLHAGGVTTAINEDVLGAVVFHPGVRSVAHSEGAAGVIDFASRPAGGTGDMRGFATLSMLSNGLTVERRFAGGGVGVLMGGRSSGMSQEMLGDLPREYGDVAARFDVDLGNQRFLEASGLWERDWIRESLDNGPTNNEAAWGNTAARLTYHMSVRGLYSRHTASFAQYDHSVQRLQPGPFIQIFDQFVPTQPDTDGRIRHLTASGEVGSLIPDETETGWRAGYQLSYQSLDYHGPPPAPYPIQTFAYMSTRSERLTVAALWGESRWKPSRKLSLQGGIRVEASGAIQNQPRVRLAPQLSGRYTINQRFNVTGGAGRSYQYLQALAPAGLQIGPGLAIGHYWLLAGENTPVVRSDLATLGAERWLGHSWLASVNLYVRRTGGLALIDPTPGAIPGKPNLVEGVNFARGIETSIRQLAGRFTWSGAYTLSFSDIEAAGMRFPSAADRRHAFDVTGTWHTPLRFLGGSFTLAQAYTAASGAPYTRLHPGHFECDYVEDRCVAIVPDVLEQPNAERSAWHLGLDQRLDWDWKFSAWRLGLFFYNRVNLNYSNDVTYKVMRIGGCQRVNADTPYCNSGQDQFHPDMSLQGVQLGMRIAF